MDADDLAREVVADPRWVWTPGVKLAGKDVWVVSRSTDPDYLTVANDLVGLTDLRRVGAGWECRMPGTRFAMWERCAFEVAPDLDDPATAGVVVGMLAATGAHNLRILQIAADRWEVWARGECSTDTSLGRAAARAWLAMGKALR